MKNFILPLLLLAFFQSKPVDAQDCKYFREGKDKASGEPFKETRNVIFKNYAFQMRKDGASKWSCSMDVTIYGASTYTITPKDTLYLKLESDEVLKLVPDKAYTPIKKAGMNGMTSQFLPSYMLPKEMLQKLVNQPIVSARLTVEKPLEGPTKKTEAEAIMKAAACLLAD